MGPNRFFLELDFRVEFSNLELDRAEFQASNIEPNSSDGSSPLFASTSRVRVWRCRVRTEYESSSL